MNLLRKEGDFFLVLFAVFEFSGNVVVQTLGISISSEGVFDVKSSVTYYNSGFNFYEKLETQLVKYKSSKDLNQQDKGKKFQSVNMESFAVSTLMKQGHL